MKILNKLFFVLLVLGITTSCEDLELDKLENPNAVSPDKANPDDLYNNIQSDFVSIVETADFYGGVMARTRHSSGGFLYNNVFTPAGFNGIWNLAYAELFPDVDALVSLANDRGLAIHSGSAKIMKAYSMMILVDLFGNVPYSEAQQGVTILSPGRDPGESIYTAAEVLLDEAIAELSGTEAASPAVDIYYDGDAAKWVTLANTLKLRKAIVTRLVDGKAAETINAIVSGGDFIDETSEDFEFQYGNQRNNPNSRHPYYNNSYENDDGEYQPNYIMNLMWNDKVDADENQIRDPRMRFYFYRQVPDSYNNGANAYSCLYSESDQEDVIQDAVPDHYLSVDPDMVYCVVGDGYMGRDHLNGEGIPPDGPFRTVFGLYPAGGLFDDNSYTITQNLGTDGALGAGITPIMLSSFVDFMRAEAALTLGTGEDARALLKSGMEKSIAKVFSFKDKVPAQMSRQITNVATEEVNTVEELFVPSDSIRSVYVDFVLGQFDAADSEEKLNILMKEYLIALRGNGVEAYNNYRRTGMPLKIQPALESGAGEFIRSMFYPANHVDLNSNASQRDITEAVYWDTNPAGLTY